MEKNMDDLLPAPAPPTVNVFISGRAAILYFMFSELRLEIMQWMASNEKHITT